MLAVRTCTNGIQGHAMRIQAYANALTLLRKISEKTVHTTSRTETHEEQRRALPHSHWDRQLKKRAFNEKSPDAADKWTDGPLGSPRRSFTGDGKQTGTERERRWKATNTAELHASTAASET